MILQKNSPAQLAFILSSGKSILNLYELSLSLVLMSQNDFLNHVNDQKNDFADWVENALELPQIASSIRLKRSKVELIAYIQSLSKNQVSSSMQSSEKIRSKALEKSLEHTKNELIKAKARIGELSKLLQKTVALGQKQKSSYSESFVKNLQENTQKQSAEIRNLQAKVVEYENIVSSSSKDLLKYASDEKSYKEQLYSLEKTIQTQSETILQLRKDCEKALVQKEQFEKELLQIRDRQQASHTVESSD